MSDRYIHGTHREEQQRLGLLNRILNERSLAELAVQPGDRVLEMGAGTGLFAIELARAVGPVRSGGRVLAVERSPEQIATARAAAHEAWVGDVLELREGDANAPPLAEDEWSSFDLVHARFLLEHLADPLVAVRHMVAAAKPGGRIVLADDDHDQLRLWPPAERFSELWQVYFRHYESLGNDPFVGRKLVALLHAAGARPERNTLVFFGGCAGQPSFPAVVDNLAGVVESSRTSLIDAGLVDEASYRAAQEELGEWARRDDASLWYGLNWAEGVRRP